MGAPVFVAGSAFPISAGGTFGFMLLHGAGAGECARRRSNFLLLRQKKVTKEKATPLSASLRFASGNLRCSRPAGSRSNSLRCAALKQSRALIRWPLRSSAHTEGRGQPNSRTSIRAIALLGPVLRAQAPRAGRSAGWVERSDDPCGCPPPVAAPAAGRLRGGMGASAPMLRELTRCGCLNEAAAQRSEFRSAPRNRPAAGLPRSAAQGAQTWGRLLLPSFLGDPRKEGAPPGAHPGTRPQIRHAASSASKPWLRQAQPERVEVAPRLRQAQPERVGEGPGWCLGFDRLSPNGWGTDRGGALVSTSSARTDGKRTGVAPRLRQAQPERAVALYLNAIKFIAASAYSISARAQKHSKNQRPTP